MSIADKIKRVLPKNPFVRGVLVLGGGTAGTQLLLSASVPFLTRMYSARDFGVLAVFLSILVTINSVSSLRYELAIPIAKTDSEAASVVVLASLISFLAAGLILLVVILFRYEISDLVNTPELAKYLWILPVSVILLSIYQIFYYWALRTKNFSSIARTKLTQVLGSIVVKLAGFSFGPLSLIVGEVAGGALGVSSLISLAIRKNVSLFKEVRLDHVYSSACRYHQLPLFSSWSGLLNTIGSQLPPLAFSAAFNPAEAGLYALSIRVVSMPMSLVGGAIGNVFFPNAVEVERQGKLSLLVSEVYEILSQIIMLPVLILAISGPYIFEWAFGAEWRAAGEIARFLTPMLYFQFIFSPISTLFSVLEKEARGLIFQFLMFLGRMSGVFIGIFLSDLNLAVILFSLASSLIYLYFFIWLIEEVGCHKSKIMLSSVKNFALSLPVISPLFLLVCFSPGSQLSILLISVTSFLFIKWYFDLFLRFKKQPIITL